MPISAQTEGKTFFLTFATDQKISMSLVSKPASQKFLRFFKKHSMKYLFSYFRGRILDFWDQNGAGKSNAMKIICGYLAPDGGAVFSFR